MLPFKRARKWTVMRFGTAAYSIARKRGGRTSNYNSLLLYGSGDNPMGVSSFVKSWLDAQHRFTATTGILHLKWNTVFRF